MIEREYAKFARDLREDGNLSIAADYYVSSAFGYFMKFRKFDQTQPEAVVPLKFGKCCINLLLGALCHRINGNTECSRIYSRIAILLIEDVRDHVPRFSGRSEVPVGLCHELIGDFRLVGDLGSHDDAYRDAERLYSKTENDRQWSAEPEFEIQILLFIELATSVDYELSEEKRAEIQHLSLDNRIQYKREHFESIIDQVIEAGNWESDTF